MMIHGDWTDTDWLLLLEDDGPRGMGRVLGYLVFSSKEDAERHTSIGALCDALDLFVGENIPADVTTEIMTYADFKASYGNRMPLSNRGREERIEASGWHPR